MKILNYGSLNIDCFYSVPHIVSGGETISSSSLSVSCGGKGLNQSIAISRAGAKVCHAGKVGVDGDLLIDTLADSNVDTHFIVRDEALQSGKAIIQIDPSGQNSIILYGGTNKAITRDEIDAVLKNFQAGDVLVLQNEISETEYIIRQANEKNMRIYLNLAPITEEIKSYPLDMVTCLIVNETEGAAISGCTDAEGILAAMREKYPKTDVLLTLGSDGAYYLKGDRRYFQPIYPTNVVNTTGAGDTFCGYFIAMRTIGKDVQTALDIAALASSASVSREGSATSIPYISELV